MSRYMNDAVLRRLRQESIDADSDKPSRVETLARDISNRQRQQSDGIKRRETNTNLAGTRAGESRTGALAAYLAEDGQRAARGRGSLSGTSQGAAPLTASSFGGVYGYRNITPVRQERPGALRRIASGTDAAVSGLLGGIGSAAETGKAALGGEADFLSDVGLKGFLTTPLNQLGEKRQEPKYQRQMDMDSTAAKLMERAAEKTQETTEGLGPKGTWVAENLISAGQNLPAMAASTIPVIGPAIGGGIMAASAGGSRAYELQQQGEDAGDAFWRGAVSGGIELATEKFSIDNFLQIAKGTGAKTAVKNLLRQMGVEASEESASYALNYIADKAARDPHTEFSLAELANSAAGGAFSGGIYGGIGLGVNAFTTPGQARTETQSDAVRQEAAQALPVRPQTQGDTVGAAARETRENGAQAQQQGVNAPSLQTSYADSLGENGRQNLSWLQERTGRNDPDFLADHKTGYELGRNGTSEEQFRRMGLAGTLSRDDQYSAFSAGHNDGLAEASEAVRRLSGGETVSDAALDRALAFPETRREIERQVGTLPGVNSQDKAAVRSWAERQRQAGELDGIQDAKPGLFETEISRSMKAEDRDFLNTLFEAVGLRGAVVSQTSDTENAHIENGVVTVYANADDAASAYQGTVRHEVTHQIKALGAEHYQAFEDFAVEARAARDGVSVEALIESTREAYRGAIGQELTEAQAREELAGDFAMLLDVDADTVRRFVDQGAQNRQTAKGILQTIRDIISRIRERFANRKLSQEQRGLLRQMQEGERLWSEALGYASRIAKENTAQTDGGTRFSIKKDEQGRKYVHVDVDQHLFDGLTTAQMQQKAREVIMTRFRGKVIGSGENRAFVNRRSAEHYAYPANRRLTEEIKQDKMRASTELDNIMEAAVFRENVSPDEGRHPEATGGMDKFNTVFEVAGRRYAAEITRISTDNGKLFYELSKFERVDKSDTDRRKAGLASGDAAATSGNAANISITDSETEVNENLSGKSSLKNSQETVSKLAKQAEVIDYLRGQMERTKGLEADPKQVKALAGELLTEYSSGYDKAELSSALQTLYDAYANRTDTGAFTEMQQQARELARNVLEESSVLGDETAEDYSQLREYLKKTPLTLSEADKADVPGGFGEFRKAHMGRLRLTNDGLAVDSAYMELNADFGEALFPSDITHPADQLAQIADVLDALEPVYENPFSRNMEEATSGLANDMIARLFKVRQAKPTFADRQAAKLEKLELQKDWLRAKDLHEQKKQSDAKIEKLMEENRQRVKKAVEKERAARDKKISDLKEKHKEQDANRRDKTSRAELRRRIERHAGKLSKKLLNPTDTQHVPEELRGAVAALLDQINLETAVQVDPVTGKRSRYQRDPETGKYKTRTVFDAETGKAHTEYVPLENGDLTKRTEAFRKLRDEYKKIIDESIDMVVDPDLPDNLDKAVSYHAKRLEDMSLEELQTVWDVLRAAEASISRAGKLLRAGRFKTIQGIGAAFEKEGRRRAKDRIRFSGVLDTVDSSLNIDMMKPWAYFYTLGEGGEAVYDSFREAQDQKIRDLKVIQDFSQKLRGDTNIDEWTGRGAKTTIFETSGGKIEMTPAQVMSLYKLMQRPQAVEHIKNGGIRPTAIQRGVIERTAGAPVKVTIEDVTKIVSTLTDEQKRIADGFGEFMSGTLADWGNETSMALYGYKKFREENYFPIQSDKNQVKEELGQDGLDMRVKQKGWTKATVKGANNAVMIDDIFDVFAKHADEMSTYHSSLSALEDASRVFNFKYIDANGKPNGSVKDTIDSILGKHGQDYYRKLFNDLNGGIRSEGSSWLFGNFKAAAVGGNMRVVMQQPTAYARAYAEMDLKYLLGGLLRRGDFQEMIEHSPIAQWKAWGYNQTDLGRPIKDIFIDQRNPLRKFTDAMMKPAEVMDNLTWTRLWNACKLEIQDTTTLEKGSDAYWKAVAKRFDKVIDRTQVVDSVLQRSQMMRSTNGLTRMSTSFMAEPTTSYNLLHVAGVDAIQRKPNAGKKFARVTMAVLLGSAATALAAALADAARSAGDDDDDKNFWERYKEAAAENFVDQINPAGLHPVLKDVLSLLQGYDVKRTDMTLIADVIQASRTLLRAQSGEGKVTVPAALAELLLKCSKVFGLPVANIKRDVAAVMNTTLEGLQAAGVNTYGVRFRWDMFKTAQNESTAAWWMNQAFAARDGGDPETAEEIFKMLHDKQLKTREEIRDYEKNVWNKDKNELVKRAFEAQADGDDEGFQMYTDALRGMGLDDEKIEEALGGKADKARRDEFSFRDYRSDIRVRIQDEAYDSPGYEMLDKEHRRSFESAVRTYSSNITKDAKIEDFDIDSKWVIACRDAKKECGLSESKFIIAYAATRGVKSLKDKDGKPIDDSPGLLKMQAINKIPGLNDKQKRYMYEACGVGKKVIGFNPGRVEQELMKMEKQAAK